MSNNMITGAIKIIVIFIAILVGIFIVGQINPDWNLFADSSSEIDKGRWEDKPIFAIGILIAIWAFLFFVVQKLNQYVHKN